MREARRPSSSVTVSGERPDPDLLAHLGEPAELGHDEAGDRLVRALGQLDTRLVGEVLDVEQPVDPRSAPARRGSGARRRRTRRGCRRRAPRRGPRASRCPRCRRTRRPRSRGGARRERISNIAGSTRLLPGSMSTLAHEVAEPDAAVGDVGREDVADVHEADDVVLRLAEHRVARVRQLDDDRGRPCTPACVASRNSTSVRGTITSRTSRSPASKTSSMSSRSCGVSARLRGEDAAQLVLADELLVGVRVAAERAHQQVGRGATAAR